jgi:membrane protease YdiL (CAAX protease family)
MSEDAERIVQEPLVTGEPPRNILEPTSGIAPIPQYSLGKILLVWAAAALPMGILGWVVAPALAHTTQTPALVRQAVLTVGLVWQFILVLILLYQETGTLRWSTIRPRLWLTTPRSPQTGAPRARLWWWLLPLLLLTAIYELQLSGRVEHLWVSLFPFFAEPQGFSLNTSLATPAARAQLVGAWNVWGVFVLSALFNTVLGEELLFRGLLLPRMAGVFGKGDWVINGLLFGLYHLHQPWGILSSAIDGILLYALPSRTFRSSWFGVIAHSGQSVYLAFLILGLVLGLA